MKKILLILIIGMFAGASLSVLYPKYQLYEQKRERIMNEMASVIEEKSEEGHYRCCIEPACDMCFMGHWIWDDGICRCDDEIAKGDSGKVCPQCAKGLEEGQCKSAQEEASYCEVE